MKQLPCSSIYYDEKDDDDRQKWKSFVGTLNNNDTAVLMSFDNAFCSFNDLMFFLKLCSSKNIRIISLCDSLDSSDELFPKLGTKNTLDAIANMTKAYPDMLVGAGTVLTVEQIERAVKAGAKFIVSPGFDPEIVDYCIEKGIPVYPGTVTPTEVAMAVKRDLKVCKFFPAAQFGGLDTIKALAAPYTMVKFMPTGGVSLKNLRDFLSCDKIAACGGTWMVKGNLIAEGRFDEIRQMTADAVAIVKEMRG